VNRLFFLAALAAQLSAQITFERIRNAEKEPGSWLTYSGDYSGRRFSHLTQIVPGNVGRLKVAWIYQIATPHKVETTPLVADGVMYVSEPPSNVSALDIRTGRKLWTYNRRIADDMRVCCGQVNRGVALLGDLVYVGTVDAYLVALDARTGIKRWETKVAEYTAGHSVTVAPLAVKDLIIVGVAGGEYGIRGFLDAYEAKSGKRAWRLWTIPGPGEPGNETWAGDSWKTGGAPTWVTGAYDPELNLIYWGTGNPGPDWNGEVRKGDNLYSDSMLAVDADTGKLRWYFQFTPHDVHDWDANQVPVLIDGEMRGQRRKLLLTANRNAFYYGLDRSSGEFLVGKPYVKQTWASGLDDRGRPIRLPNTAPTVEGTHVWPSVGGGTNWYSPSYSPKTDLFYVAIREASDLYYIGEADYRPGVTFFGGMHRLVESPENYGAIRALRASTGEKVWDYRLHSFTGAGVLSTAGGLVFGAAEGTFFALDALTGKRLWRFQTGGNIGSNPISYLSDGKQHVAIAAGNDIISFALE
jgi:alcohol dehydrogenase (cytochrome c)